MESNLTTAAAYFAGGLGLLPIVPYGSKAPAIAWGGYTRCRPAWIVVSHFWASCNPYGIAILGGAASGNLEILDDDADLYGPWAELVERDRPGLVGRLPLVLTPTGGHHVYYRTAEPTPGSAVLARTADGGVRIETRGQGAYAVAPGSPPATHPTGRPYTLLRGDLAAVPTVTAEERSVMHAAARTFDNGPPRPEKRVAKPSPPDRPNADILAQLYGELFPMRPGDRFNVEATWEDVLEPHGWTVDGGSGGVIYWRKPDAFGPGHHATTGHGDGDCLYVFSTSAPPFEDGVSYSKFAALTLLEFDGDYREAAQELARRDRDRRAGF